MTTPDPAANGHRPDLQDDDDWSGDIDLGLIRPGGRFRSWWWHRWMRIRHPRGGLLLPRP